MAQPAYHERYVERFERVKMYLIRSTINRQIKREQDEDIREALRSPSASAYLKENR